MEKSQPQPCPHFPAGSERSDHWEAYVTKYVKQPILGLQS
jgi:hypothetical protein